MVWREQLSLHIHSNCSIYYGIIQNKTKLFSAEFPRVKKKIVRAKSQRFFKSIHSNNNSATSNAWTYTVFIKSWALYIFEKCIYEQKPEMLNDNIFNNLL